MKISLCTIPSFAPRTFAPSGARADRGLPPKLAIVALVSWMEKNGYTAEQYDFYDIDTLLPSDEAIAAYFREYQPDVVGLSAIISAFYPALKRIAAIIRRECPNAWIVMGGHMAAAANTILRKTEVDICVAGDGEIAWVEFLNYAKQHGRVRDYDALRRIGGLCFLDADGCFVFNGFAKSVTGEDLVQPDYDLLRRGLKNQPELLEHYFDTSAGEMALDPRYQAHWSHRTAWVVSSKGCVAKCTFCQRATKGYRRMPVEKIEEHVVMLKEKYGVGVVKFFEENFGSDVKQAYEIARIMKKHDILWVTGSLRVTTFKAEDYKFLREHNCLGGYFGLESGAQWMLETLEKKTNVDLILKAFQDCVDTDFLTSQTFWLMGNPGDDEQSAIATGETSGRLAYILGVPPSLHQGGMGYVIPVPGTPLYEYAQQVGVIPSDPDGEETYLNFLNTTEAAFKRKYVNVNGAPRAEVLFWDVLAKMEASRTYRKLVREHGPRTHLTSKIVGGFNQDLLDSNGVNRSWRVQLSSSAWATYNPIVDMLPRRFIYPIVKYVNWLINGVAKDVLRKLRGQADPCFPAPIPPRLTAKDLKGGSLRKYVNSIAPEAKTEEDLHIRLLARQQ